jgi:hypothetical protein
MRSAPDLRLLAALAGQVGVAFKSRCVVADFAREVDGGWTFMEAGPGSCAGAVHKGAYKAAAARLRGESSLVRPDAVGGIFEGAAEQMRPRKP